MSVSERGPFASITKRPARLSAAVIAVAAAE